MSRLISMRVKKLHFILLFGLVFLLWNFITYYTISSKPLSLTADKEKDLTEKLLALEVEMAKQLADNRLLLEGLKQLKENQAKSRGGIAHDVLDPLAASPEDHIPSGSKDGILPILMIACDRVTVNRALDQLLKYRPSAQRFPIIVSQDCGHDPTAKVIEQYVSKYNITHIKQPDLRDISVIPTHKKFVGYYKIARHYKWALNQIFYTFNFSAVVIVEDDLDVSPDFYEYFSATYPILQRDPMLWCVSAWNDNGKDGMVSGEADLLYRTDFFPGLGWMIERKLWLELSPKWPDTFWDDWMRHPEQRKGRECIRPEICRTSTFGKKGVSKGLYYDKHLKFIKLNSEFVPFTKMDLSYLQKEKYDEIFTKKVYSAPVLTGAEVRNGERSSDTVVRVEYTNKESFKGLAKALGIMDDFKAGVPRAAYRGVVSFMLRDRRIFLAPPQDWKGYDTSWS
ncbi:alpha-1,3-mannosyl-glycoprotein 2-beta-N-acetylglucosaminyltransferase-like isoform X2 [Physella acuta]|nr:alpha-1,3-mannosyl-glycoprotein 2-beta-N-acetylglucosaminyltransferase-like isoform X2 [Physella acuta]XP_059140550.1 alpha-1,3-mannosyl-glycoprotein 2-beta-N-acetylglucosaminyltransferase-like isoform X2 [Physella acuta]XP_059140551.1 alpha-1,3-mannosyl-glycoprotein 2-beta-N-acetylglucosaminyltransferase-like isoform X2 [Physella acuta]